MIEFGLPRHDWEFIYPTQDQLRRITREKPARLTSISYKSEFNSGSLCGIQLGFEGGQKSSLFETDSQYGYVLQTVKID